MGTRLPILFSKGLPYAGIEVTGWPVTTIVRGQVVVANSLLTAEKGTGEAGVRAGVSRANAVTIATFNSGKRCPGW